MIADFVIQLKEGSQSAFKWKNLASNGAANPAYPASDQNQNVPGAVYSTESGFENIGPSFDPQVNPSVNNSNSVHVAATSAFPSLRGLNNAGVANAGTRLTIKFNNVINGTRTWVPTTIRLTSQLTGLRTGIEVLTDTDANGGGAFSATPSAGGPIASCSANVTNSTACPVANTTGLAQVSTYNGSGLVVYEVLYSDAFTPEQVSIPVVVAYVSNLVNNLPAPFGQTTVLPGIGPLSVSFTSSSTEPRPRFIATSDVAQTLYTVTGPSYQGNVETDGQPTPSDWVRA